MELLSDEEFDKLSLNEKKEELIRLIDGLPDDRIEGLYYEIEKITNEE